MPSARLVPVVFVLLWATGFIGARYAMPHAEPFGFLAVRFAITFAIFAALSVALGAKPTTSRQRLDAIGVGALIHGLYLSGVFFAIDHGMPAGLTALIIGLQPLLTALIAWPVLSEPIGMRHWLGLAIGFAGLVLVLAPKMGALGAGVTPVNIAACLGGALAISAGTVWQKRALGGADLVSGTMWQYLGGALPPALLALAFESGQFEPVPQLWFALVWLVLVLSVGAIFLLMLMIRDGAIGRVSALFYLVPAVTALMAWGLFGERLDTIQLAGMALTMLGVWLAMRSSRPA